MFFSRQLFEEKAEDKSILSGYLILNAENANADTILCVYLLPPYENDRSDKRIKEIRAAIDSVELGLVKEIEMLEKPPQMYSGELESDDKTLAAAVSQIANALGGMKNSLDGLVYVVNKLAPKEIANAPSGSSDAPVQAKTE